MKTEESHQPTTIYSKALTMRAQMIVYILDINKVLKNPTAQF